jgi:hypothetical protein
MCHGEVSGPQRHAAEGLVVAEDAETETPVVGGPRGELTPIALEYVPRARLGTALRPWRQKGTFGRPMDARGGDVGQGSELRLGGQVQGQSGRLERQAKQGPVGSEHAVSVSDPPAR